jgi:hypothetical protein
MPKLKALAIDMKTTAEEHMIRGKCERAPDECQRKCNIDNTDLAIVLTLHEREVRGRRQRHWLLTVANESSDDPPEQRLLHRVLRAFFGHGDFANEAPQDRCPERLRHPAIRTFFAAA